MSTKSAAKDLELLGKKIFAFFQVVILPDNVLEMNELSNWILNWILGCVVLVLLAPIFHMADQELERWSVITVSQFNTGLAEPTFTAFQVIVGLMFALAVIGSYKSDHQ